MSSPPPILWPAPSGIEFRFSSADVDWKQLKSVLAQDGFDNGRTPDQYARAFESSWAVGFAWSGSRIVGKARIISDGVGNGYLVDVWTQSEFRGQGIAASLVRCLLDRCQGQHVVLFTSGAEGFYQRLGFTSCNGAMESIVGRWLCP